ncbi:MAG TPA: PEP-CTERM sorting domain-containing protein [Opitutaceae bacterium]|nr:PEP-CTERM sorting domain-containing protein [Opitutaceae bacterium]
MKTTAALLGAMIGLSGFQTVRAQAIINGGFETGTLSGWTVTGFYNGSGGPGPGVGGPVFQTYLTASLSGTPTTPTNGVISSQTNAFDGFGVSSTPIAPPVGSFMGFVTNETSSGNNSLTGSMISQTFTVPTGITAVTLQLALLNNDSPGAFVNFNDFAGVALTQGSTVLSQYNLDLNSASSANLHVTDNANLGGFRNSTPFVTVTLNLSGLAGQSVTLNLYSINYGGDNSVETRLLVDGITLVPEPGTVALLVGGLGLIGLAAWRRRLVAAR